MLKFWRVSPPGEQSIPGSRQDIYRFPDSRTVFCGQIPDPFQTLFCDLALLECGTFSFIRRSYFFIINDKTSH